MSARDTALPIIDLGDYFDPGNINGRQDVIRQVRDASQRYGFFQVRGHGIPLSLQQEMLRSMTSLFNLPQEEKLKMSFLSNPCRRGYEAQGMSHREGDSLSDAKECFHVSKDDSEIELGGFYGPNIWPDLPAAEFREPVSEYYQQTKQLGKTLWSILLESLGLSPSLVNHFCRRPIVPMKMIRYPPSSSTLKGQFGIGPHTDFGGITVLMQQPGREGLEVWDEERGIWIAVPALENILVVNCGDMVSRWSRGFFKSAQHRVLNKTEGQQRLSCATFWHGDLDATNPLNPDDPSRETIGQLLVKRFGKQYSLTDEVRAAVGAAA